VNILLYLVEKASDVYHFFEDLYWKARTVLEDWWDWMLHIFLGWWASLQEGASIPLEWCDHVVTRIEAVTMNWWHRVWNALQDRAYTLFAILNDWTAEWYNTGRTIFENVQAICGTWYWRVYDLVSAWWQRVWYICSYWWDAVDSAGVTTWTKIIDLCYSNYYRFKTVVTDWWEKLKNLCEGTFAESWETFQSLWESIKEVCETWYWKIRFLVVDNYTRLVQILGWTYSRLMSFLVRPDIFIYTWMTDKAHDLSISYKSQMQSTFEHVLRYLWEGVW